VVSLHKNHLRLGALIAKNAKPKHSTAYYASHICSYTASRQIVFKFKPKNKEDIRMAELMDRITVDPQIMVGKPVIKGTRITVQLIVQLLANGETEAEILEDYPDLKKEDVKTALLYASECLNREEIIPV
jgi:uncharacterized protein (DUF433 family)